MFFSPQGTKVLKRFWRVFKQQKWPHKLILLVVLLFTLVVLTVFAGGYIVWQGVKYVLINTLLAMVDTYLARLETKNAD